MVLCLLEHDEGTPEDTSVEMLTLARDVAGELGADVDAMVVGDRGDAVADAAGEYGVDTLHVVQHDDLDAYAPAAWAESLDQLASAVEPDAVLAPGSDRGHEVLARFGAMRDLPMAANCMEVTVDGDYEVTRQRWGGTLIEHARLSGEPKLLTAAANEIGAEPAAEVTEPSVESVSPSLEAEALAVGVERIEESEEEGIPLGEARVVVGGGRGVGSGEDFDKLEELADQLGAAIGSSRAAVNEGWRSHDDQIGQTGAKIAPKLYIPCGISGAVQHMVGAKGSDNILAINTDPEAAIIGHADWAVVADLHEVVPELNEAIESDA
jgi:electron transfer flavoprotein alpha subunit